MSEFEKIVSEYSNIAFNDDIQKRDKSHTLFQLESYNIVPQNYQSNIFDYGRIITWNGKLYAKLTEYKNIHRLDIKIDKVFGFPLFDNEYWLDSFVPLHEKQGVCLICRHREGNFDFDISHKRLEVMQRLNVPIKHCYGKVEYGENMYKGTVGKDRKEQSPSSLEKLKTLNRYKFNLCFENCYHEQWSWDYITEKITDCFKAKTVPIYWGCYNIQDYIPKDIFIDFREWINNLDGLSEYLNSMSDSVYEYMTEKAYEFVNGWRWGNIEDLRKVLNNV